MDDSNPYQSPSDDPRAGPPSLSRRRRVRRRGGAQSRDFANVTFMMKFIGGMFIFVALALFCRIGWWAVAVLVESVLLLIIGFGLGAYHRWA